MAIIFLQGTPQLSCSFRVVLVVGDSMMKAEANIAEGFDIKITPSGDLLLIGVYCLFCIGSRRLLDGYQWRVHDLPLSLAHEEALHHGRPTGIVGAIEHGDEGGEAGRHSCLILLVRW